MLKSSEVRKSVPVKRSVAHRMKAVIVEDDQFVAATIAAMLAKKDIDVISFPALTPARDFLEREKVNLAIVDLGLPDGEGLDLVKYIRSSELNSATPIIIATANKSDSVLFDALGPGGAMFVSQKPINWQCLEFVLDGTVMSQPA